MSWNTTYMEYMFVSVFVRNSEKESAHEKGRVIEKERESVC